MSCQKIYKMLNFMKKTFEEVTKINFSIIVHVISMTLSVKLIILCYSTYLSRIVNSNISFLLGSSDRI